MKSVIDFMKSGNQSDKRIQPDRYRFVNEGGNTFTVEHHDGLHIAFDGGLGTVPAGCIAVSIPERPAIRGRSGAGNMVAAWHWPASGFPPVSRLIWSKNAPGQHELQAPRKRLDHGS